MSELFHGALLIAASRLVRAPDRAEWLAEWNAELCYIPPSRCTAFCLGAFRDAFWMRRHAPAPVHLQSPLECLAVLGILAVLSLFCAFRMDRVREILFPSAAAQRLVTISGIPLEDYRLLPGGRSDSAFYGPAEVRGTPFEVALASRNLAGLVRIPLIANGDPAAAPLVLTNRCWRSHFHGDPHIVGRHLTVGGRPAQIVAVAPERVWLPGRADAWMLVDDRSLSGERTGYAVARLSPSTHLISVRNEEGGIDRFTCVPLAEPNPLLLFLVVLAVSGAILPAVTSLSLGKYPLDRHLRRWIFLAAKFVLVLPIVLFGSLDLLALIAVSLTPHAVIVGGVLGFRWILVDQRRRCPVCLRVLTHPTPIGDSSRTLLEWYGTELVCTKGHGLLHVPEFRTSYTEQRWLRLDSSWSSLF